MKIRFLISLFVLLGLSDVYAQTKITHTLKDSRQTRIFAKVPMNNKWIA